MRHPLQWIGKNGKLADALGLVGHPDQLEIERRVNEWDASQRSMRELLEEIGEMDISDERWANFLYTLGYWQGQNSQ